MGRRQSQLRMGLRIVVEALRRRRSRTLVALLSVVVGASVTAAMVAVTHDADAKVGKALRGYGPNLLVVPRAQGAAATLPETLADQRLPGLVAAIPVLYRAGEVANAHADAAPGAAVLVGARFPAYAQASPWWHVQGALPTSDGQCLVGSRLAKQLSLAVGDRLVGSLAGHPLSWTVSGVLDAGDAEDAQVFVGLPTLQRLADLPGRASLIAVVGPGDLPRIRELGAELTAGEPEAEARPVLAIASSQGKLLAKLHGLMLLVTLLVVACSALCTGATLLAAATEREREFGLMKALGASRHALASLFLGESAAIGVAGGLLGFGVGLGFAHGIAESLGIGAIAPDPLAFAAAMAVALSLATGAGALALGRALAIDPIVTLKGE